MKSPFKFLDAYTIGDKDIFFGRDQEIEQLYDLVYKSPMIVLYGLSGTGKTSLVQCGLSSKFEGPDWYPIFIRRQTNLNESIQSTLAANLGDHYTGDLIQDLIYLNRSSLRPLYLLFDQFEEIFILGSKEERTEFFSTLSQLLEAEIDCHIMLIMREEYLGQLYPFESMLPTLFDFKFRVERMNGTRVKSVIKESFDKFNISIEGSEEEILQQMVDNISDPKTGIALPYLQVYLDQLYKMVYTKNYEEDRGENLPPITITKRDIVSLGAIENVLDKFLSQQKVRIEKILKEKQPNLTENFAGKVLDVFATDEGTKRPLPYKRINELIEFDEDRQALFPVKDKNLLTACIELFEEARILRLDDDDVELAHDSLAALIDHSRSSDQKRKNELKRRILNAYDEYKISGQHLNEKQLQLFEDCPSSLGLSEEVNAFISNSQKHWEQVKKDEILKKKQELEFEQQKKTLKLEQRASRLKNGLIGAACLILPILIYLIMGLSKSQKELSISQEELRVQLDSSEIKRKTLVKINEEFKGLQETLEIFKYNPDLSRDSLRTLLGKIDSSFVEIASNVAIKALTKKRTKLFSMQLTDNKGNVRHSFKIGERIYLKANLFLPYSTEKITYRWVGGNGDRSNVIAMARNESPEKGRLTDYKSAKKVSLGNKVQILDQQGKIIGERSYDVTLL